MVVRMFILITYGHFSVSILLNNLYILVNFGEKFFGMNMYKLN